MSLRNVLRMGLLVVVVIGSPSLISPSALAYTEDLAGDATVDGVITFAGTPPPPKLFPLGKFANSEYCSKTDSDGQGNRVVRDVVANDGKLQDVVVYIRNVTHGKPFEFHGTDVTANGCRFLIQGPSTFVGVVAKGAELRVLNEDADPSDRRAANGVLHDPHPYEVLGMSASAVGRAGPLPEKGQTWRIPVVLKKEQSIYKLECDQHLYEQVFFLPIENPYYAIVGPGGTYAIDRVPAGTYEMIAWHPKLGKQMKTIEVGDSGKVTVNFEFSAR